MRGVFAFAGAACAWERSFFAPSAPVQTVVPAPALSPQRLAQPLPLAAPAPVAASAANPVSYFVVGAAAGAAAVAASALATRRVSPGVSMSLNVKSAYDGPKFSWSQPGEAGVWDPLNLLTSQEKFERLRYVEVKHGRVAMLAVLGHIIAATGFRWPGEAANGLKFADVPGSGFAALSKFAPADLALILVTVGFLETRVMKETVKGDFPGDLRNGLFKEGWDGLPEATRKSKINIELNNGRAAMMGITALMVHENLDGKAYVINELLGMGQPY